MKLLIDGKIFLVEDEAGPRDRDAAYAHFKKLPYTLSDADRADTMRVRHLAHQFTDSELEADPVAKPLVSAARRVFFEAGINVGALSRVYANFNLHGDVQFAHRDGECWTSLFFLNNTWEGDWGGELIAYQDESDAYAYAVTPRPGRAVFFDGGILHRGGVPSKLCFEPRISLAIKFAK
jgi:SM-20-related protein